MYARLTVAGGANAIQVIRDIGRLITSSAPSISDLSGQGATIATSSIIDNTPAGWTYVSGSKSTDLTSIGSGAADATLSLSNWWVWGFSAPCLNGRTKYCALRYVYPGATITADRTAFALSGAQLVGSAGVLTNEGTVTTTNAGSAASVVAANIMPSASTTIHVVANPRHVTIIQEGRGMHAVWETTASDLNERFNSAPIVQYTHGTASSSTINTLVGPNLNLASGAPTGVISANTFNSVDLRSGTVLNTTDASMGGTQNFLTLVQTQTNARANSIDSAGNPKYQVSPIYFQMHEYGWPAQFVSGVTPAYWCRAGIGSSGDTVSVGGDIYTFFTVGASGSAMFGIILKTS